MERFTEYNGGVAVIKDKSRISEAMKRLAEYEDTNLDPEQLREIDLDYQLLAKEAAELRKENEKHQWIPVEEPPKTDDYVLLSFGDDAVGIGRYEEALGTYYIGNTNKSCLSYGILKAWMPLPEHYRED